jgi:hypothetical protein
MYQLRFFKFVKYGDRNDILASYKAHEIPVKGDLVYFGGDSTGNHAKIGYIYKVKRVVRCYSNHPGDVDLDGNQMNTVEIDVVPTKVGQ